MEDTRKDTREIRKCLRMSQKEFAESLGLNLRTVQNWDSKGCMPDYVSALLESLFFIATDGYMYSGCVVGMRLKKLIQKRKQSSIMTCEDVLNDCYELQASDDYDDAVQSQIDFYQYCCG